MAPRIPIYSQQTSARASLGAGPTGNLPRAVTNAELLGQTAGALSQVAGQFADRAKQKEEEDAAAWSAEKLSQARLDWTQQQIQREQEAPPGAKDYAGQLTKDFDEYANQLVLQAPTEKAREYLRNRMTDMKTSIVGRGMEFEAGSRLKDRLGKIDSAVDSGRITVDLDPSQYQTVLAENMATLNALDIPQDKKAEITQKAQQALSFSSVAARMRDDPRGVLQQLGKEDGGGAMDVRALNADNRIRLRNQAEAEIKRREIEAKQQAAINKAELAYRVQDAQAAYMQGKQFDDPPTAAELKATYGADRGQQIYSSLSKAQQFGTDMMEYASIPVAERAAWLESRRPAAGGVASEGFAEDAKLYGQLLKGVENINAQLREDGAGYAIKYAPEVAQAWQGVMEAAEGEEPAAYRAYAEAVQGEQARLGIQSPAILPKQYVSQIAAAFKDPANAGARQTQMINALKSNWGEDFPSVFRQVSQYVPNSVKVIGAGVDSDTEALLSGISTVDTKTLKAPLPGTDVTDMNNALKESMAEFGQTFAAQGAAGLSTFNSIYDEAYRGALAMMASGKSPKDAASEMSSRLTARYERDGTLQVEGALRVPAEYDMDTVQEGAAAALEALTLDDVTVQVPPGISPEASNRLLGNLLRASTLVTNSDETGVFLMFNGTAVLGKDGRPLQMSFDDLITTAGAKASGTNFQLRRDQ